MTWRCSVVAAACVVTGLASAAAAGQVKLEIHGGLVTMDARDATVGEICAEWARVGRTTFVNADQVTGGPLTLQLSDVPERHALEIVLRTIAGFVAEPRPEAQDSASLFGSIRLMPAPRPASAPAAGAVPASTGGLPQFPQFQTLQSFPRPQPPTPLPDISVDDPDEPQAGLQTAVPAMVGAPQPGMTTPAPQQKPAAPNDGQREMPANPGSQPATRPGVPTAPPPQPNPIKG
jgi:hypothetical protein